MKTPDIVISNPFDVKRDSSDAIQREFENFVGQRDFPCVGAKSALSRGTLRCLVARAIDSAWDDVRIHEELRQWAASYQRQPGLFRSLAVIFEGPTELSEQQFEHALWTRIQSLSDKDVWRGLPVDEAVSPDPSDPHFSLSFGGEAFFVVGLHPRASRLARRFRYPTLVFNLHDQFETLRTEGRYEVLREAILKRDEALSGDINPMLARHGTVSEARQYSGRIVDSDWTCPFSRRTNV